MGSTFNPHILVEKLSKLNNSQASIETLSHWCIFHMNKAKQVVETWDRQFHCSARDRRLAFLYLANDILQNSRRKGAEFVGEFWKVLPGALRDVIDNGDEAGRNAALRLIGIWEERKVFGSRGQILKEELARRHLDNSNGKPLVTKSKPPIGTLVDKIVSSYQAVYGGQWDEDGLLRKCRDVISCIEKGNKEISGDINSGQQNGTAYAKEAQEHKASLRGCIEQLIAIESSRASLVSYLREALQEQEFKLDQVRNQLQAAHSLSERAGNISGQFLNRDNVQLLAEQSSKEVPTSIAPQSFAPENKEQYAPVMYTQQAPYTEKAGHIEEDPRKSAAAAVAAKLTASTSSAQMLSFVLSSLASEGIIGNNPAKESSSDHPPEKRPKLDGDQSPYIPAQISHLPGPPFPHPESLQHNLNAASQQLVPNEPPPPPPSSSSPLPLQPPMPGLSMAQFMQSTAGSMSNLPYSHIMPPPPMTSYQTVGGASVNEISPFSAPPNSYQNFQGSEGNANFYAQP